MAAKIDQNWLTELREYMKTGKSSAITAEDEDRDDLIRKALRAKMSKEIRDRQMRNALLGYLTMV